MSLSVIDKPGRISRTQRLLLAIVAIVACATALVAASPASASRRHGHRACRWENSHASRVGTARVRHAVLCLINHERAIHGLPKLHFNRALNNAAQNWANTMVATGNSGNGDLAAQISAVGYNWSQAGSVVGSGFATASRMVSGWMGDPGHCDVILDPVYRSVGTGVNPHPVAGYWRKGATFAQDYGLGMGQSPASGNWGPADGCPY
jgi:uncharacterized protein YkwD